MNQEQAIEAAACIYLSNWRDRPPSEQEWVTDAAQRMVRAYLEARYDEHSDEHWTPADTCAPCCAETLLADFGADQVE